MGSITTWGISYFLSSLLSKTRQVFYLIFANLAVPSGVECLDIGAISLFYLKFIVSKNYSRDYYRFKLSYLYAISRRRVSSAGKALHFVVAKHSALPCYTR